MENLYILGETTLRFGAFAGIFAIMALLEFLIPKRELKHSRWTRWITNLSIVGADAIVVRLMAVFVIPLAAVAAALWAEANGWGVFNRLEWPAWLEIVIAVAVLDLAIYGQHVASHKIPLLWRLHKVHHTDVDIDVTTGIRFHPIEIALSMLWKIVVVIALGAAAPAVVLFEVLLNGTSLFNHSNIDLPRGLDRFLRGFLVTPDMHRVHHSVYRNEHDTNFGFNLSFWDRLFGTYTDQPRDGHQAMTIGLPGHQNAAPTRLIWSLVLPFLRPSERGGEDQKKLKGK